MSKTFCKKGIVTTPMICREIERGKKRNWRGGRGRREISFRKKRKNKKKKIKKDLAGFHLFF